MSCDSQMTHIYRIGTIEQNIDLTGVFEDRDCSLQTKAAFIQQLSCGNTGCARPKIAISVTNIQDKGLVQI